MWGAHYGWSAITDVCEASRTLRGYLDLVGVHNGQPVTVYGWAVDPLRTSVSLPVEIYVGGPRGTGTLVATVTANRPRADVNQALGVQGNHGFAWAVSDGAAEVLCVCARYDAPPQLAHASQELPADGTMTREAGVVLTHAMEGLNRVSVLHLPAPPPHRDV